MADLDLSFEIEAYSPTTFPMGRLGEYLADLGTMLGEQLAVHFVGLKDGSTCIHHKVDQTAAYKVEKTIADIVAGTAQETNIRAFASINKKLKEDGAGGRLKRLDTNAIILPFPGISIKEPTVYGPISQNSVVDGVVISLGGRDSTVPVRVQNGGTLYICTTTRDIARQLGMHLFGDEIRFQGIGKWVRHETLGWSLESLKIDSFELLEKKSMLRVVAEMRAIKSDLSNGDFWGEILELRHGGEE